MSDLLWTYSDEAVMEAQTVAEANGLDATYMEVYESHLDVAGTIGIELAKLGESSSVRIILDKDARRDLASILLAGLS